MFLDPYPGTELLNLRVFRCSSLHDNRTCFPQWHHWGIPTGGVYDFPSIPRPANTLCNKSGWVDSGTWGPHSHLCSVIRGRFVLDEVFNSFSAPLLSMTLGWWQTFKGSMKIKWVNTHITLSTWVHNITVYLLWFS